LIFSQRAILFPVTWSQRIFSNRSSFFVRGMSLACRFFLPLWHRIDLVKRRPLRSVDLPSLSCSPSFFFSSLSSLQGQIWESWFLPSNFSPLALLFFFLRCLPLSLRPLWFCFPMLRFEVVPILFFYTSCSNLFLFSFSLGWNRPVLVDDLFPAQQPLFKFLTRLSFGSFPKNRFGDIGVLNGVCIHPSLPQLPLSQLLLHPHGFV